MKVRDIHSKVTVGKETIRIGQYPDSPGYHVDILDEYGRALQQFTASTLCDALWIRNLMVDAIKADNLLLNQPA